MPRLEVAFLPLGALAVAAGALAIQLRPTVTAEPAPVVEPPPPAPEHRVYTLTITTDPPRTVSVVDPPPIQLALTPLDPCTELDLDGDGVPERWDAQPDSCGTGGCVYDLYMRDRFVGVIEGHCPFVAVERRDGLPSDILATWRLGVDHVTTRYRFAGGRYRTMR